MKNVVNAIDREGTAHTFLQRRFPWIRLEKLKAVRANESLNVQ